MRKLLAIPFHCLLFSMNGYGKLTDIAAVPSPDGAYSASIRLISAKELGQDVAGSPEVKVAVLLLHDARTNKKLQQFAIPDADDTDNRNSIALSWSPDGRALVLQVQIGQLSQFALYHVVSQRLVIVEQLPTPKELAIHSPHQNSRGGTFIQKWSRPDTFVAVDTVSNAQYTYQITKQWKLQAIASKPIDP